ncbi:MAG: dTDP-4-dehydrorhamnose reductase [Desulfobulbaceae bacterium]|nr:dTDP-4-dehydrorhamnose reductase [Desulfobulbaceae bacterium]
MKVLIAGANGQLGRELVLRSPDGWQVTALGSAEMDLRDREAVLRAVAAFSPELIINGAAYTAVDRAEIEPEQAYAVNGHGVAHLAEAATSQGARFIHVSTDFVFDGRQSHPYGPSDRTNPVGVYGASKLEGERLALAFCGPKALIIRTSWLYGVHGNNFVKTMLRLMAERDGLRVVDDQVGTPTWAGGLAAAIWRLAAIEAGGIHHWSDAGVASWYDFAVAIQEEGLADGLLARAIPVEPIASEEYLTPARRPAYSVLDKRQTWQLLGEAAPHWRVNLRTMLHELKELDHV